MPCSIPRSPAFALTLAGLLAACAKAPEPEPLVPGLAAALADLPAVVVEQGGETLRMERAGPHWRLPEAAWRADRRWLQPLLLGLAEARCDEPRTADPGRFARIGVDWPPAAEASPGAAFARPTARIRLAVAGREWAVVVGHPHPRGGTYVRVEGAAHSCLSFTDLRLPARPGEWLDPRLWQWPPSELRTLSVEDPGQPPLRLVQREGRFLPEGALLALSPLPDALAAAASAPRQQGLRPRSELEPATGEAAPVRRLRLEHADGRRYGLALYREGARIWAVVDEAPEAERDEFARRAFELPPDVATPLLTALDALRG